MTLLQKLPTRLSALLLMCFLIATPIYASGQPSSSAFLNEMHQTTQITEGTGPKTLYIVFDPNCPYCHLLFKELRPYVKTGKVTIHWIPVGILTDSSPGKAAAMLQAKDPLKAFYFNERGWSGGDVPGGAIHVLDNPDEKTRQELLANNDLLSKFGFNTVPITFFFVKSGEPTYFEGAPSGKNLSVVMTYVK